MRLQMKCADGNVIVLREKWGTLAFQIVIGLMCLGFAAIFYRVFEAKAPTAFLIFFCGIWAFAGACILLYLPRQAKKVWKDAGAHVIAANTQAITLTPNLGSISLHYPWSKVSEVILADRLTLVDTDETTSLKRQVIVMLNPDAHRRGHWIHELGSGIAKTGEGRAYVMGVYPKASREELARTLQSLAPGSVPIRVLVDVIFNLHSQRDSYAAT